jgi:O-acetyl-ADP-ribose deacetylase (regulator of RNase III)
MSSTLRAIRADITTLNVDAIVNTANGIASIAFPIINCGIY